MLLTPQYRLGLPLRAQVELPLVSFIGGFFFAPPSTFLITPLLFPSFSSLLLVQVFFLFCPLPVGPFVILPIPVIRAFVVFDLVAGLLRG
jgi:hypothetical protein